jgi:hypothetical protein
MILKRFVLMPSPPPLLPSDYGDDNNNNPVMNDKEKEKKDYKVNEQGTISPNPSDGGSSGLNGYDDNNRPPVTIFELLDELISHMNTIKNIFMLLILSSFILAPIALIVTGIFVLHPFFLYRILFRLPAVGGFLLLLISVSIMLASIWLFIGASEWRFFSDWNKKFSRYISKRKQVDKELG